MKGEGPQYIESLYRCCRAIELCLGQLYRLYSCSSAHHPPPSIFVLPGDKVPRVTAGATAGAGAKQGPRSVRAWGVLGGDDTNSDGDEAPRAEEEAVDKAEAEAAEKVKAEPAPALEPAIKREPSDSQRQQQQRQQQQQRRPTCVSAVSEAAPGLGEGWRRWPARACGGQGGR